MFSPENPKAKLLYTTRRTRSAEALQDAKDAFKDWKRQLAHLRAGHPLRACGEPTVRSMARTYPRRLSIA